MSCDDNGPKTASDCTPCSPGLRNRYFRGKLLTVADYDAEQRYTIQRRRLINRAMLGWGVVSGFRIAPEDGAETSPGGKIEIGEGFALDPRGRELVACEPTRIRGGGDVVWLKPGRCGLEPAEPPKESRPPPAVAEPDGDYAPPQAGQDAPPAGGEGHGEPPEPPVYLLSAHYAERRIDGVVVTEGCGEEVCEANRICETVIYSLRRLDDCCPNGLAPCPDPRWGMGESDDDYRKWAKCAPALPALAAPGDRGPHSTLVGWSMARSEGKALCSEPALSRLPGGIEIDPAAGVPLACVTIGYHCGDPYISRILDSVGPRRLARPNETLFDLIRGCDLTRIEDVGWRPLLGRPDPGVPRDEFFAMFVARPPAARTPPGETRFWVRFSGPVQIASLTTHVITFTLMHWDSNARVQVVHRIPVASLRVAPQLPDDPPDTTRGFLPIVDGDYWADEIGMLSSSGFEKDTIVEIGVRGSLIVDANGQLVAAGGGYVETRPGWPGSDFISAFTVIPPPASARRQSRRGAR